MIRAMNHHVTKSPRIALFFGTEMEPALLIGTGPATDLKGRALRQSAIECSRQETLRRTSPMDQLQMCEWSCYEILWPTQSVGFGP